MLAADSFNILAMWFQFFVWWVITNSIRALLYYFFLKYILHFKRKFTFEKIQKELVITEFKSG